MRYTEKLQYLRYYVYPKNLEETLFSELLSEPSMDTLRLQEGKQVVCFFSTGCHFCQLAAQKLSIMQQLYGFPPENITYVFMGSEEGIRKFYELSESAEYRNVLYGDVVKLLKVINGYFPTIVFLDRGTVVHEYGLRNMKEEEIKAFFTQP